MHIFCCGFELYSNILKSNYKGETDEAFKISYIQDGNYVILEWMRPPVSGEYKKALNEGLYWLKESQARKWVGLVRVLGVIEPEDKQWEEDVWFPQVLALGIDKIAIVTSEIYFNQEILKDNRRVTGFIQLTPCYFTDLEEAILWIKL